MIFSHPHEPKALIPSGIHLHFVVSGINLKESQELYIALFMLIYVWSARVRHASD